MQTAPVTPEDPIRAVDMTTPWSSLVDTLVCMIENSAVGRANGVAMLRQMAADADEAVAARAAAPDFLLALKLVAVELAQCRCHRKLSVSEEIAIDAARDAIAKAEGR